MRFILAIIAAFNISVFATAQTVPTVDESKPAKGVYALTNGIEQQHTSSIVANKKLGSEGYILRIKPHGISVEANSKQGLIWGEQTLRQLAIAHSEDGAIPCQTIIDKPDYPIRGFMIDCGRKYIPLSYLRSLVKVMAFYKMNTLHLHLNDNGFKQYFHNNWDETYTGFRLESDLFPGLTSKDGYYTKQEMRDFIRFAASEGVEIIPEFDMPAHSLAFTHYRPSLSSQEFGADHLNLRNPDVIPFVDSLLSEYLGGPDPVFCCPRMHIGTDEYSNKDTAVVELFRAFTDHLIHTVESYGKQAVMWGSLTHADGKTPVKADGVLMDMWYNGYADPQKMKQQGYDMVSIPDGYVYIVPEAGYYYNYLNCQFLYEHWTPAQIGDQKFEEKDPQIKGGMFALWNDVPNGISIGDLHHRILPAIQVIAEKTWHAVNDTIGYAKWDSIRKMLYDGPEVNEIGTTELSLASVQPNKNLAENANSIMQIGYDYQVDFDITWSQEALGTELISSPRARVFLADPIGGWLGFSRDGMLYTFEHKGRPGTKEHITIKGTNRATTLLVNGKKVQELGFDQRLAADGKPYNMLRTLVFPLQQTGNFKSSINNFSARKL